MIKSEAVEYDERKMLQVETEDGSLIGEETDEHLKAANALRHQYTIFSELPGDDNGLDDPTPSTYVPLQLTTDGTDLKLTGAPKAQTATVLQYTTSSVTPQLISLPGNLTYQVSNPVGTSNHKPSSQPALSEEAERKRQLRLLKNREAALECRRKKKDYIKCLENRVALLENQNKTLIDELKALKELYCQK